MADTNNSLRLDLLQPEFSEGYAESFLDAWIATQIKVLREQEEMTQTELAKRVGTRQTVISRYENVNYSSWSLKTLKKLARAFRVRLRVSFETYGSLIPEIENFSRASLARVPRERDPELLQPATASEESDHLINTTIPADKPKCAADVVLRSFRRQDIRARSATRMEMEYEPGQRSTSAVDMALRHDRTQSLGLGSLASGAGNQRSL
jgi:transcriptional regulator with XRE-family HTH domain